jgi:predicted nucleotidyltransferase
LEDIVAIITFKYAGNRRADFIKTKSLALLKLNDTFAAMILTKENIKQVVQDYFKDKPVKNVYLFGSYARGQANTDSDVDLIIDIDDTKKRISLFDFIKLQLGIENALNKKVDLVEAHLFFPRIKKQAEKEKLILYKR